MRSLPAVSTARLTAQRAAVAVGLEAVVDREVWSGSGCRPRSRCPVLYSRPTATVVSLAFWVTPSPRVMTTPSAESPGPLSSVQPVPHTQVLARATELMVPVVYSPVALTPSPALALVSCDVDPLHRPLAAPLDDHHRAGGPVVVAVAVLRDQLMVLVPEGQIRLWHTGVSVSSAVRRLAAGAVEAAHQHHLVEIGPRGRPRCRSRSTSPLGAVTSSTSSRVKPAVEQLARHSTTVTTPTQESSLLSRSNAKHVARPP